jgi:hypothetical protein
MAKQKISERNTVRLNGVPLSRRQAVYGGRGVMVQKPLRPEG